MTPEEHQRLKRILFAAAERTGEQRSAYLDEVCGGDDELRRQVERLLEDGDEDSPAIVLAISDGTPPEREAPDTPSSQQRVGGPRRGIEVSFDVALRDWARAEAPPDRVGPYQITKVIGQGGMGIVYLARQQHPDREVALKVIRPGMLSPKLVRRFELEVNVLGQLHHPGIAQIYDAGVGEVSLGDGRSAPLPFFAMEFIRGEPLNAYAKRQRPTIAQRLELMASVCDAVHHAHQKGVVHRDLKPGNILVNEAGQPKILDFGVARATDAAVHTITTQTEVGQIIGTLPYMSPEQIGSTSDQTDVRSDVYALGVILYELLAGKLPFDVRERSIPEATRIIQEEDPSRMSSIDTRFRGDIETIVSKALEKDKERRYQSAAELAADIRRYLRNEPIAARPATTMYQLRKFARRHRALVGLGAATVVVLIAGIISTSVLAFQKHKSAEQARTHEAEALRKAYRASIAAASSAISMHDPLLAGRHLEAAPEHLRNWEWRYLQAQLDSVVATVHIGDAVGAWRDPPLAFRADGSPMIASVGRDSVRLEDLLAHETIAEFGGGRTWRMAAVSRDGSLLAAVSEPGGQLNLWDVSTGTLRFEAPLPAADFSGMKFSPDGSLLELHSDSRVIVLDVRTRRTLLTHQIRPDQRCARVMFSVDGSRLALHTVAPGNHIFGSFHMFDTATGSLTRSAGFGGLGGGMALSPDGGTLALGTDDRNRVIRVLDAASLKLRTILRGHSSEVIALAFSPDGKRLASASSGVLRIWDVANPDPQYWRPVGGQQLADTQTESMIFNADASILVIAAGDRLQVLSLHLDPAMVLRGHPTYVYRVAYHPDGTIIASTDFDQQMRLWDAITGEPLAVLPCVGSSALAFNRDGSRILQAPGGPSLQIADPVAWSETAESIDHDQYYALARAGSKHGRDWQGESEASSPDGTLVVLGSMNGEIVISDLATHQELHRMGMHPGGVRAVAISPDNSLVVSGGDDHTVRAWDVASGRQLTPVMEGHSSIVYSVNFSPDGTRIVSGGNDNNLILWDAETFEPVAELHGHSSYVHSVAFSPDGTQLISGSGDGTVRIWDSLPRAERFKQARAAAALRAEAELLVDQLLNELDSQAEVATRLRGQDALAEPLRKAALRVLLRKTLPP